MLSKKQVPGPVFLGAVGAVCLSRFVYFHQDERHLRILRELLKEDHNKRRGELVRDFMKNKYYHKLFYKEPDANFSAPSSNARKAAGTDFPTVQLAKPTTPPTFAISLPGAAPPQPSPASVSANDDFGDFVSPTSANPSISFPARSTSIPSVTSAASTVPSALPSPSASFAAFPAPAPISTAPAVPAAPAFSAFSSPVMSPATPSFAAFGAPLTPVTASATDGKASAPAFSVTSFNPLPTPKPSPVLGTKSLDVDPYAALRGMDTDIAQRSDVFTAPPTIKPTGGFVNEVKSLNSYGSATSSTPSSTSFAAFPSTTPNASGFNNSTTSAPTLTSNTGFASFPTTTTTPSSLNTSFAAFSIAQSMPAPTVTLNGFAALSQPTPPASSTGFAAFPAAQPTAANTGFAAFPVAQPTVNAQQPASGGGFPAFGSAAPLQPVQARQNAKAGSQSKDMFGDLTDTMKGKIASKPKPSQSPYGAFGNFMGESLI
ncbi:hypothetical protein HK097_009058 [Rhizophlyctis rosea]|uniref:Uncharacterized protein n=1 Tax=Rhizophlyctis rosea TaxID=64517 RepID=A0AAD5S9H7_9FUNG|nr:hypothetical protein HK097_009058 [Rhizophlyctis rosea]